MTESQKPATNCDKTEAAAREYLETCKWSYNIYGDKSGLSYDEQKKHPSDIPTNLSLAFLAGVNYEREQSKVLIEALESIANATRWAHCNPDFAREAMAKYRGNKPRNPALDVLYQTLHRLKSGQGIDVARAIIEVERAIKTIEQEGIINE